MALVEGIGRKLLPVGPDLLQHLGIVTVTLSLFYELWLHVIQLVFLLLTHCLAQGVALATGEVGKLA